MFGPFWFSRRDNSLHVTVLSVKTRPTEMMSKDVKSIPHQLAVGWLAPGALAVTDEDGGPSVLARDHRVSGVKSDEMT